jgi:hypothetical protein
MTENAPEPLPADAVLVHVGMFKTGTTALQNRLAQARPQLAAHGVLYPGVSEAHHRPAQAFRRVPGSSGSVPDPEHWDRLCEEVKQAPGRVVVSSEFLAQADAPLRGTLVEQFGGERVHVVIGVRNPASHVLSSWQQTLKDGRTASLPGWLERTFRRDPYSTELPAYWRWWDPVRLVRDWLETVGPDRLIVTILDERDRDLLGRTFEQLLGLPPRLLNDIPVTSANRGLTLLEAESVRRLNGSLRGQIAKVDYSRLVRYGVIRHLTDTRQPVRGERRPTLPQWAFDQAGVEAQRIAKGIAETGARIAGDFAGLTPPDHTTGSAVTLDAQEKVAVQLSSEVALGAVAAALVVPVPPPPLRSIPAGDLAREIRRRAVRNVKTMLRAVLSRRSPTN